MADERQEEGLRLPGELIRSQIPAHTNIDMAGEEKDAGVCEHACAPRRDRAAEATPRRRKSGPVAKPRRGAKLRRARSRRHGARSRGRSQRHRPRCRSASSALVASSSRSSPVAFTQGTHEAAELLGIDGPVGCADGSHIVNVKNDKTLLHHGIRGRAAERLRSSLVENELVAFLFAEEADRARRSGRRLPPRTFAPGRPISATRAASPITPCGARTAA